MKNTDLIKEMYANFSTGNVPAVLALYDPTIEWRECMGMPFVEGDGIFIGPDAVVANVFMKIGEYFDGFNIAVTDIFGEGDKVAMVGYYQGTNKATGKPFKANAAHIWTLKDGKVTHFFQAVDTALLAK
ncbi:nuclear transport factor 2 family protein [Flavihumibacter fluvii]|uniref:nuclear transport factor 2 family protein n=1 Tax=Flavihumibacter fluvii TaxID=2838157 RepID=UPI001BDE9ED5|nr:nuclear transport factor 2 family protein [Flavihumibacter fluvii]ULQ50883.1 nuclear transport factor 2 family protein [Flavihumibacter fluvii]